MPRSQWGMKKSKEGVDGFQTHPLHKNLEYGCLLRMQVRYRNILECSFKNKCLMLCHLPELIVTLVFEVSSGLFCLSKSSSYSWLSRNPTWSQCPWVGRDDEQWGLWQCLQEHWDPRASPCSTALPWTEGRCGKWYSDQPRRRSKLKHDVALGDLLISQCM